MAAILAKVHIHSDTYETICVDMCVCVCSPEERNNDSVSFSDRILDGDTLEKLRETDKISVGNRHQSRQKVIVSVVHSVHYSIHSSYETYSPPRKVVAADIPVQLQTHLEQQRDYKIFSSTSGSSLNIQYDYTLRSTTHTHIRP